MRKRVSQFIQQRTQDSSYINSANNVPHIPDGERKKPVSQLGQHVPYISLQESGCQPYLHP